jgi:NAD(P)H-hydrate epimerase
MRFLTADEMREADRRCIDELGIPGAVLMENAGRAVFGEIAKGPVGIVCGKGNNGGDGYVVARLALLAGYDVRVVLLAAREDITGDALTFLAIYERLGGRITIADTPEEAARAVQGLSDCGVVIDAMLGTGFKGDVHGAPRAAIENWPDVPTIAVDIPSGLNADTGEVAGPCIRAAITVTMQYAKRGFSASEAQQYLGRLVVADIGIPDVCADAVAWEHLKRGRT